MQSRLSKSERLQMIICELCEGKQTILAEKLGKSQQNMNAILNKGTWYDAVALKEAMPELNDGWLLTGEGEMMMQPMTAATPGEDNEAGIYCVEGGN